jgi:AraC-like DNA-binding protein
MLSVARLRRVRPAAPARSLIGDADVSASARMVEMIDRFAASTGATTPLSNAPATIEDQWQRLRTFGLDRPGLAFAAWLDLGLVGGVVPPLLANCSDVSELLNSLARFHPLWGDDEVVLDNNGSDGVAVTLRSPNGASAHGDTLDAFFAILARVIGQLTMPAMRPARLLLRSRDVEGYPPIATIVRCGAHADQLEFSAADLATPIAMADPAISAVLVGYAETAVAQRAADWEQHVRSAIRSDVSRVHSLGEVASRLAQSPRTLQQRLLEQGTSYATLLDDERRLHALALLGNSAFAVATVAHRCGYNSAEGFSRAVRRWTGSSPTEWRSRTRPAG